MRERAGEVGAGGTRAARVRRLRRARAGGVGAAARRRPQNVVALGPQLSYFAGMVAAALEPGAEVVGYAGDFTSVLFPFLERCEVRLIDDLAALPDAVRSSTALVAVSAVQSADGSRVDLAALREAGAPVFLDATQASGWLPIAAGDVDFLAAAAYKWLLSPRGTAFMAVRPEAAERLRPTAPGWFAGEPRWDSLYGGPLRLAGDARRLDLSPAWLSWVGTAAALEYLEGVGVEAIHAHDVALANRVRDGARARARRLGDAVAGRAPTRRRCAAAGCAWRPAPARCARASTSTTRRRTPTRW